MAPDHAPDDPPGADEPLPPEDRLWRHPSEIGAGISPPAAWFSPAASPTVRPGPSRKVLVAGAMVGACLTGALVAVAAMWITRPTRVVRESVATTVRPVASSQLTYAALPTEDLAADLGPSLPGVRVERSGSWTSGSGVWLDGKGTVLTAAPLVAGAGTVVVTGRDGVARGAEVIGSDDASGVAVLRVDTTSGEPLDARPASARGGEPVVMAGAPNPDAAGEPAAASTAMAVVRVRSMRAAVGDLVLHDAIQLDRVVPSDSVGGILVDGKGRFVGVVLGTSSDHTLGVVTPAGTALSAARSLRDHGKVVRAWLGVKATDVDPRVLSMLQLTGGANITEVTPGSPAETAGLQVGDLVTAVDDTKIDDATDLVLALRRQHPGDEVTIHRVREGKDSAVRATLAG